MKTMLHSLRAYIVFTLLLGIAYPLAITFIAQASMPYTANGSLVSKAGRVVGSRLIGQNFAKPEYFQPRQSANNWDGTNSGATNLGPSSKKLMDQTAEKVKQVRQDNALAPDSLVPADMALTSASGLDPHISPANALIQSARVARIRGIPREQLQKLIERNTDPDFIGIWGRPGINVLTLNMALDELGPQRSK